MSDIISKPASTIVPIAPFLANRWSPRVFDSQHVLTDGDVLALAEAARWAPSSNNAQPWKIAFLHRASKEFQAIATSALTGFNQSWAPNASLFAVICAEKIRADGKEWDKPIVFYNAGLVSAQIVFQAEHMGLRAHYMGGIVHDQVERVLELENLWVVNIIAIGKQASEANAPEELQIRERAPRERRPLEQIVLHGLA